MWTSTYSAALPADVETLVNESEPSAPPLDADHSSVWLNVDTGALIVLAVLGSPSVSPRSGLVRVYHWMPGTAAIMDLTSRFGDRHASHFEAENSKSEQRNLDIVGGFHQTVKIFLGL